jgi:hypothetical protein
MSTVVDDAPTRVTNCQAEGGLASKPLMATPVDPFGPDAKRPRPGRLTMGGGGWYSDEDERVVIEGSYEKGG